MEKQKINFDLFEIEKNYEENYINHKKNNFYIYVIKMSKDEINYQKMKQQFIENTNMIKLIFLKIIMTKIKLTNICKKIITSLTFEIISLLFILTNCFTIVLLKTKSKIYSQWNPTLLTLEELCFYFYCFELIIKVFSLGLFFGENTYFRDPWNILDFAIIFPDIVLKTIKDMSFLNIKALRAIRVLKPLRTITKIKNLQLILSALFSAIPLLGDSFLILIFFYLIFAVAGLQLFQGLLKKQCFYSKFGIPTINRYFCGNVKCPSINQMCGKMNENPNFEVNNFDNIFYAFFNVFQIVTMDGWTGILYIIQRTFTNFISIYFVTIVILGGFFLVNLMLAIIKVKFTESHKVLHVKVVSNIVKYDLKVLKLLGLWNKRISQKKLKISKTTQKKNKKKNAIYSEKKQLFLKSNTTYEESRVMKNFISIIKWTGNIKKKLANIRKKEKIDYNYEDYQELDCEFLKSIIDFSLICDKESDVLIKKINRFNQKTFFFLVFNLILLIFAYNYL